MASLKEVKNRINSVSSTRKITSAMKLVASSKLHKAQGAIESMQPYARRLGAIMTRFVGEMQGEIASPYVRNVKSAERVAILAVSSNSSLCGAFNANVVKELTRTIGQLRSEGVSQIEVIPIGTKVAEKVRKMGFAVGDPTAGAALLDKPTYAGASQIAEGLMQRFADKELDKVILIYNHFKNTATQVLTNETFLPINLDAHQGETAGKSVLGKMQLDYIIEPSREAIVSELIPRVLHLQIYTMLLDSLASEHSARVIAMQVATDNADQLLEDLTLMYNKTRQAAITSELLDIVGASFQ